MSVNKNNLTKVISNNFNDYDYFSSQEKDEINFQLDLLSARNFLSTKDFIYFVNTNDSTYLKSINLLKLEL